MRNVDAKGCPKRGICVIPYETFRKNYAIFTETHWDYVILDEGHLIKNPSTILHARIKSIIAEHRLMLTGTPIQNCVSDLWALFDLLMPGYLGTEKEFHENYVRPLSKARDKERKKEEKEKEKEMEEGDGKEKGKGGTDVIKALEELHAKVLPFMLRRMKETVLEDLPPKVIRDVILEMQGEQKKAYEMAEGGGGRDVTYEETAREGGFGRLNLLRRICTHAMYGTAHDASISNTGDVFEEGREFPNKELLPDRGTLPNKVIELPGSTKERPEGDNDVKASAKGATKSGTKKKDKMPAAPQREPADTAEQERDAEKGSAKLAALLDLLKMCYGTNKVLVFCQFKESVDHVIRLAKMHFSEGGARWMRIDGSVKGEKRARIAREFNDSPDVAGMVLTTQAGGVGLNLTGADTVIFLEHDWNPVNDLQAMDRVHRIGQKNSVSIFRLITKDTIEERMMSLQEFKKFISNSVVNQQNADIETMDIGEALRGMEKKAKEKPKAADEERARDEEERERDAEYHALLGNNKQ